MGFLRRFGSGRAALIPLVIFSVVATFSYVTYTNRLPVWPKNPPCASSDLLTRKDVNLTGLYEQAYARSVHEEAANDLQWCPAVKKSSASIDLNENFSKLEFNPGWLQRREYWDSFLEQRYKERRAQWDTLPLKVIVLPHSHNDPGWLHTFDEYYSQSTQSILDNMVTKLRQHKNMTFIWTEVAFFAKWWQTAHPAKQREVKRLVGEGKLEFTSGTWVMTDEATVHWYSMLDQMIEGHQWLKNRLGISPTSVWSIDPFGHGPVAPYLLRLAGLSNTVVQRVHYAWKKWLADHQLIDFFWKQPWETESSAILCHNFPFDIYSIKHSCGPDPRTCLSYDFRKLAGEYTEYSMTSVPITKENVAQKAEILLEQYGKQASLHPHNVALVLLGDDFRYNKDIEWDQQYINYMNIFNYINSNFQTYKADIQFGTLTDYFNAVRSRAKSFPTVKGDFFPYSDIFSEGRAAYWTGYFTTRPSLKQLAREVESALRATEIIYAVTLMQARQNGLSRTQRILDLEYSKLVQARRNLALFQHHDAITGTSKAHVMRDYGEKLFAALRDVSEIQRHSAAMMLAADDHKWESFKVLQYSERTAYDQLPNKPILDLKQDGSQTLVLYNSDPHFRHEVVRVNVKAASVRVYDSSGKRIHHQVNPIWVPSTVGGYGQTRQTYRPLPDDYNLIFIAALPPLSLSTFHIVNSDEHTPEKTTIYCSECGNEDRHPFSYLTIQQGDIQIENKKQKLVFDGDTGFLKSITLSSGKTVDCYTEFGAYPSAMFHSGAYLFMPDPNSKDPFIDVLKSMGKPQIFIISGSITSEISVLYNSLLMYSTIIYHRKDSSLQDAIQVKVFTDLGANPNYREHEFFLRFKTSIRNFNKDTKSGNNTRNSAVFYTDQNGFQMQKRVRVTDLGTEANYYPITTMAYIEDTKYRLNLLVGRAHGFSSLQPGWMEVMLDRRTIYDDGRGMGEGITDSVPMSSSFFLILEEHESPDESSIPRPSLLAHVMSSALTNPASLLLVSNDEDSSHVISNKRVLFLNEPLPCNVQLVNVRVLSESSASDLELASNSALMIVHNRGFDCSTRTHIAKCKIQAGADEAFYKGTRFVGLNVESVVETSLTGLHSIRETSFDQIRIPPMEVRAFNLTFL